MSYFGRAIALSGLFLLGGACGSSRQFTKSEDAPMPIRPGLVSTLEDSIATRSSRDDSTYLHALLRARDLLLQKGNTPLPPEERDKVERILQQMIYQTYIGPETLELEKLGKRAVSNSDLRTLEEVYKK